jgi:AraC-like DNA-binding protein
LQRFNEELNSNYPIEEKPNSYRLRINSSSLIEDLNSFGIIPNKTKVLNFPEVPNHLLVHFIRGFLDGDGWIVTRVRKNGGKEICIGFSNGSHNFMNGLICRLRNVFGITNFNLRERRKITKKGSVAVTYQLEFYSDNANKIICFLYDGLSSENLSLKRKFEKQLVARRFYKETDKVKSFGRRWLSLEDSTGKDMTGELFKSLNKGLVPREIARELGISLSTLYRWLDKSKVRTLSVRGSEEWTKRILTSKGRLEDGR